MHFQRKNSQQGTSRVVRYQRQNVSVCCAQENSYRFLNHHNASREMSARIRLVELRTEGYHGEWSGTKYFEPKNPFSKKLVNQATLQPSKVLIEAWVNSKAYDEEIAFT